MSALLATPGCVTRRLRAARHPASPLGAVAAVRASPRCCCPTSGSACSPSTSASRIVAVGIGLAWGRGGLLSLGQGVFFGLGGYAMAMHLKLADAGPGNLPDFMQLYGSVDELPLVVAAVRATRCSRCRPPCCCRCVVAFLLGSAGLPAAGARRVLRDPHPGARRRVRRSCSIGQQGTTGGTNGLTDFQGFFGYDLDDPVNQRMVYFIIAGVPARCCSRSPAS